MRGFLFIASVFCVFISSSSTFTEGMTKNSEAVCYIRAVGMTENELLLHPKKVLISVECPEEKINLIKAASLAKYYVGKYHLEYSRLVMMAPPEWGKEKAWLVTLVQ